MLGSGGGIMKLDEAIDLYSIHGRFMGYELKDGYKIRWLKLSTPTGIQSIRLSKSARASLFRLNEATPLKLGMSISLRVKSKLDGERETLKAYEISPDELNRIIQTTTEAQPGLQTTQTQIWVCDRGTCRQRGSQQVCAALTQEIRDLDLSDLVRVKTTGCLKACKHGVNVEVNGICHHGVSPSQSAEQIRSLIQNALVVETCVT
jgi:(2Fe-2S) ferredoxin